ncbi:3-oxoacyl-ACP synthase III family protein [Oceanihabitans sediminis]|uniref:Ketoacyl-ACP synthase III n=1 Tax=Oceanihabitans sediminis TaxID=1812012 RepID=A0A368P909_9FLAO|nr:ketoacyl-ACP synthase III [Oceanihabitans sediminis]MDX1279554.1 ketoacyl-ACP synthase III [Oceanihabitans sediminis]RBP32152.1 3-oxoacyl-[acyl-carrier-protein] synthase-3 [Oceanihabitans sediminis]RCU58800.1 ketoacyl-ACP synthase III [Oceanihabitans sediminis]
MAIKITGTGSYVPDVVKKNEDFNQNEFLNTDGSSIKQKNEVIIQKFKAITGIKERRYTEEHLTTSDLAFYAAKKAIEDANINPEELDYIIVGHNYGDIKHNTEQSDTVPSIGSRVKHLLGIRSPKCVAYDLLFGCPGWNQGVIHASAFIKAGLAKKCLIIGAETLSRVVDKHDRDSMIYSDGAGAVILEETKEEGGIINQVSATHTVDEAHFIYFGETNNPESKDHRKYIKMYGRKIYEFALNQVPAAMKACLDNSGYEIKDLKKILIHQANEKMDEAIVQRFYKLYDMEMPQDIMPMTISMLGNSSVATVPTLYDMILKGKLEGQSINKGDLIMFASVGAGMNINAIVYKY